MIVTLMCANLIIRKIYKDGSPSVKVALSQHYNGSERPCKRFLRVRIYILKAADICELLEVIQTSAYEIIGNLNKELEEQGYLTLRGKVPTKYFVKRFYGVKDTCEIPQEEGKEWFHA